MGRLSPHNPKAHGFERVAEVRPELQIKVFTGGIRGLSPGNSQSVPAKVVMNTLSKGWAQEGQPADHRNDHTAQHLQDALHDSPHDSLLDRRVVGNGRRRTYHKTARRHGPNLATIGRVERQNRRISLAIDLHGTELGSPTLGRITASFGEERSGPKACDTSTPGATSAAKAGGRSKPRVTPIKDLQMPCGIAINECSRNCRCAFLKVPQGSTSPVS